MIFFSIIANNDSKIKIDDPYISGGAAYSTYFDYKDKIESVYLFISKTINTSLNEQFTRLQYS